MEAGAQVKFPLKMLQPLVIEPYAALSLPLYAPKVFKEFPDLGIGGGAQVSIRGGNLGAFFLDVNYMYYLGDALLENQSDNFPNPDVIHYQRSVIGIGIGYKFGFFDRNRKAAAK
jgi:hypothetical protein